MTYAADELASASYYMLTLAERGLLDAMRRAIWCDDDIAAEVVGIAVAVRRPVDEVQAALTPAVLAHFKNGGEGLTCAELERQKQRAVDIHKRQSEGANRST